MKKNLESNEIEKFKENYGKIFFSLVNLGNIMKIEPNEELRKENNKFELFFKNYEQMYMNKNKEVKNEVR